jgi:hypothetical protein
MQLEPRHRCSSPRNTFWLVEELLKVGGHRAHEVSERKARPEIATKNPL